MANCPRCGSESIQIKRDTNVDWGRAIVGTVLFGVVGGAVGAVTGEERNANVCLNCGASWQASVLYEMLQFVEEKTGKRLDLTNSDERGFLNEAMRLMNDYSAKIKVLDGQSQDYLRKSEEQSFQTWGCLLPIIFCGCFAFLVVVIFDAPEAGSLLFFLLLLPSMVGFIFLGASLDTNASSPSNKRFEQTQASYENQKKREKAAFDNQFAYLCNKYSFIFE